MLIRQKAGWQLHHQAYLWPRKFRATPQPLPRRRQSQARRCRSRVALRHQAPCGQGSQSNRHRAGSSGGDEVDSSLCSSSPEDLSATSSLSPSSQARSRSNSCSSDPDNRSGGMQCEILPVQKGQRVMVQTSLKSWFRIQSRAKSDTRADTKIIRTRSDTRNIETSISSNNLYSILQGSSNLNNNLFHWGSNTDCSQTLSTTCSSHSPTRMGVLCTEKHCHGQRCACGGALSDDSPKPATLPESSCQDISTSKERTKNSPASRKRSLDASFVESDDTSLLRRRMQRSPSNNGLLNHGMSKDKLPNVEVMVQNGFKHENALNGISKQELYNCVKTVVSVGTDSPGYNQSTAVFPAGNEMTHVSITDNSSPSSIVITGSSDEAQSAKRPMTLSTLTTPLPQQHQKPTQGYTGSTSESSPPDSCPSKITSPNPAILRLRQRSGSGSHSQHKPSSLPASPLAESTILMSTSASSPSLSSFINEPPSPPLLTSAQCKWRECSCELDTSDLLEHIRKHAETQIANKTYSCLWEDCKVYDKPSWSGSWLERHIVTHSGHRPFKCILDNCGQRFHSQAALERHVNGHFTANTQNGVKCNRSREEINHRIIQKRKKQMKRRSLQAVKKNDFFDEQTMALVKQDLVALTEHTQLDISGNTLHTTFQGLIVGRRESECGSAHSLVEFTPSAVLEDKWIPEEEAKKISRITLPLSELPNDTVTNLHACLYRRHRFRKHRRK